MLGVGGYAIRCRVRVGRFVHSLEVVCGNSVDFDFAEVLACNKL